MLIEKHGDIIEKSVFDDMSGKMIVQTTFDSSAVIEDNIAARNATPEFGKYKGNLVKVGSIHMGDITRLFNMGYDVLSADPEESRRALLYIQSNEPHLLTITGKPFAKVRSKWL
jgi:hypothetical protein